MKTEIVYYYRGMIERGEGWAHDVARGYSEVNELGYAAYPWMTKAECRQDAEAHGLTARFVEKVDDRIHAPV